MEKKPMTKKELVALLNTLDDDAEIVIHSQNSCADFDVTGYEQDSNTFVLYISDTSIR